MKILPEQLKCSPDDSDLLKFVWHITGRDGNSASRSIWCRGHNRSRTIFIHRIILERIIGRPLERHELCDHINGDGMDNRRENLRLVDAVGNGQNMKRRTDNASGYRGVHFCRCEGKWVSSTMEQGRRIRRYFKTVSEAAADVERRRQEAGYLTGTMR